MAETIHQELFTNGTNIDYWLSQLEIFFKFKKVVMDEDKIGLFKFYLDKDTFNFVNRCELNCNYKVLKEKFKSHFGRRELFNYVYLQMFVKRYQKPGERMLEYATALNSLGMNAFPNLSLEHLDQYLVNQYLTGLQKTSAADCL